MVNTLSPDFSAAASFSSAAGDPAHQVVVDAVRRRRRTSRAASADSYRATRRRASVPLRRPDRAAGLVVQLDGQVGDAAGGDVGGDVDLAAPHDAQVDDAPRARRRRSPGRRASARSPRALHQRRRAASRRRSSPRNRQIARKSSTSLISGVPVSAISSGRARAGPDALGEREHVLRALRRLVLDEVRLVDDHAAEAEVAQPAQVPVEHLVVDDRRCRRSRRRCRRRRGSTVARRAASSRPPHVPSSSSRRWGRPRAAG